jgi:hypothetical protein
MPAKAKKSAAKKPRARKGGARVKKAKVPMAKDLHDLASEVAGQFAEGILKRGGSVSARDSKDKSAVQLTGKFEDKKLTLRIAQR